MKDILEKEIQISDLYPPTNVVRTDFSVLFANLDNKYFCPHKIQILIWTRKNLDGFIHIIWTRFKSGRLLPTSACNRVQSQSGRSRENDVFDIER